MINSFLKFEEKNALFEKELWGFYYWPYIRYEIFTWAFHDNGHTSRGPDVKLQGIGRMIHCALFYNTWFLKSPVDILAMGYPRKIQNRNGKQEDPYIGPIIKNTSHSTLMLERYSRIYNNFGSEQVKYLEDTELLSKIVERTLGRSVKKKLQEESQWVCALVEEQLHRTINPEKVYQKIAKSYSIWMVYSKKYNRLLKRVQPKCIIETPGYADHNQVLNEVAKKYSIPTVEIEHGFILESHVPYNFIRKMSIRSAPDYLFAYTAYQKDNVRFAVSKDSVKVVGSPYLENRVKGRQQQTNPNQIVVLGDIYYGEDLAKFSCELAEYLLNTGHTNIEIVFKAHPIDHCDGENYKKLRKLHPEVEIIQGTKGRSVYDCLETAGKVVGISTSTLFEAQAYGAQVFVIDTEGSTVMKKFVDQGYASYINQPCEMFGTANLQKPDDLWPHDALAKTLAELDAIIENRLKDF